MASPNVAFDNIPASIRKPGKYFEFNAKLAVRSLPTNLQRLCIVAQMLAIGMAVPNVSAQVFDSESAAVLYGRGSQAHRMVKAALTANRYVQLFVVPVIDAGGSVAAAGAVTYTGVATTSGFVTVNVAGTELVVPVSTGDTAAVVAASTLALLNLNIDLPVSRAAVAGAVNLVALNKGLVGNAMRLTCTSSAPGISVAITAFAGGLNDPSLAVALAANFSSGHEIMCVPYTIGTPLTDLRTHLNAVGGPMEQRGAVGVYATGAGLAAATTQAGLLNAERMTHGFSKNSISTAEESAAAYAAVIASEEDPARPLNTLALAGITAPIIADRLSRTEQETCLANGVTPFEWGPGGVTQIVRAISTYILNPGGVTDVSWLDLTTIRTMDYVRKAVRTRIELRFPRDKLSARTAARVRSEILNVLYQLEELEIVENVALWAGDLIVERDLQDNNRLNAKIPTDIVNGLHVFAGRLDLIL